MYFQKDNDFPIQFNASCRLKYLEHKGWRQIFRTIRNLRRTIKNEKPFIVHSHLFLSSLLTRLATPKNIPVVNTLHSVYSVDAFGKNKKSLWAERLSLKKHHSLVAVSKFVLDDYLSFVRFKGNRFVLHNFLPGSFFENKNNRPVKNGNLKCVAIGNLKEAKNYDYLLKVFELIKDMPISLDIYGDGDLKASLCEIIETKKLNIRLCGTATDIKNVLGGYDLFIQASEHEGFGLSVIEAIASKLPVFISDIPVFREITNNYAHFFPLHDIDRAVVLLRSLLQDTERKGLYVEQAYKMAKVRYSQAAYRDQLLKIYDSVVNEKIN
ncbi:MAG TPA: glycosyltransferase [Chitinophagaceae bacterium]|nr:glycosyltransferase [Chitinophagaceae bacterium]